MRFRGGRHPRTELTLTGLFRLGSYIAVLEERVQESVSGSEEEGGAERERELKVTEISTAKIE